MDSGTLDDGDLIVAGCRQESNERGGDHRARIGDSFADTDFLTRQANVGPSTDHAVDAIAINGGVLPAQHRARTTGHHSARRNADGLPGFQDTVEWHTGSNITHLQPRRGATHRPTIHGRTVEARQITLSSEWLRKHPAIEFEDRH